VKMKKVTTAVLVITLVMCVCQCSRNTTKPQSPLLGRYTLTAHDNSGQVAFTGSISVTSLDQNHLKGQCAIVREKTAPNGLLDQNSLCEALVEGTAVSFDLAPMMDDAGILLDGQFNEGRISGIWRIDGFATSPPMGKFEAVKKG
jgi:hypothetical protein